MSMDAKYHAMLDPTQPAGFAREYRELGYKGMLDPTLPAGFPRSARDEFKTLSRPTTSQSNDQSKAEGYSPTAVSFASGTNTEPKGPRRQRKQTGIWEARTASESSTDVSFSEDTNTLPRRRIQRKQTGIWGAQQMTQVSAQVGGGGVSFAAGTKVASGRPLARQLTGPGEPPPPAEVSFSDDTNTGPRRRIQRQQTGLWDTQQMANGGRGEASSANHAAAELQQRGNAAAYEIGALRAALGQKLKVREELQVDSL